jgi:hypothetical protein
MTLVGTARIKGERGREFKVFGEAGTNTQGPKHPITQQGDEPMFGYLVISFAPFSPTCFTGPAVYFVSG